MKRKLFPVILFAISITLQAQDITFVPQDTLLVDTLGSEIIFTIHVTNISAQDQIVYMVRTINDLPPDWQSSLCFSLCFAPSIDSIATNSDFGSSPLRPGETREVSIHVFAQTNPGTAILQVRAGTFTSPNIIHTVNLTAVVNPTSVYDNDYNTAKDFSLSQNYPNPFNPSTKIRYSVACVGAQCIVPVQLKVFDMLGREVATLVNEEKSPGTYEVEFFARGGQESGIAYPASGIYFYRLSVGGFSQSRKMILEK